MNRSANPSFKSIRIILLTLGVCLLQNLHAQSRDQKSLDWQLGAGNTYLYDDYLSPLPHEGASLLFSSTGTKPLKWNLPDSLDRTFENVKWTNQSNFTLNAVYGQSLAGSNMFHGNIELKNSLIRKVIHRPTWSASTGPYLLLGGGGRYCLQNGNNPGSLDIYLDFGLTALTDYTFIFWKKQLKLTYQGSLALSGLAFSPEYAESYYEIFYLKNNKNILKYTHPLNNQHWMQQLSLDVPLSHRKSSLRLSVRNDGHITLFNNIRTRILSTHFSVGYIRYFKIL